MDSKTKKWGLVPLGLIVATILVAATARAATVSVVPANPTVPMGLDFTLDLVGTGFPATVGGAVNVSWDPAIIMMDVITDVALATTTNGGPWSPGFESSPGTLNSPGGTLTTLRVGNLFSPPSGNFPIATLTFTPLQSGVSAVILVEGASWGPVLPPGTTTADPILVTYQGGTVTVSAAVPEPTSMLLIGSVALGLLGLRRRLHV